MVVTGLIAATAVASKWILAAKIMIAVGGGLVIAGPVLDKTVNRKRKRNSERGR